MPMEVSLEISPGPGWGQDALLSCPVVPWVCSFVGVSSFGGRTILLVDAGKQLTVVSLGCSQGKQSARSGGQISR